MIFQALNLPQSSNRNQINATDPSIEAGPAYPKIPAGFAGIADLLRVLEHSKLALNVAFVVRHEYFFHPKSGNLQEVSRESVHIYSHGFLTKCAWQWRQAKRGGHVDATVPIPLGFLAGLAQRALPEMLLRLPSPTGNRARAGIFRRLSLLCNP